MVEQPRKLSGLVVGSSPTQPKVTHRLAVTLKVTRRLQGVTFQRMFFFGNGRPNCNQSRHL
jgi:hypothetical protein